MKLRWQNQYTALSICSRVRSCVKISSANFRKGASSSTCNVAALLGASLFVECMAILVHQPAKLSHIRAFILWKRNTEQSLSLNPPLSPVSFSLVRLSCPRTVSLYLPQNRNCEDQNVLLISDHCFVRKEEGGEFLRVETRKLYAC